MAQSWLHRVRTVAGACVHDDVAGVTPRVAVLLKKKKMQSPGVPVGLGVYLLPAQASLSFSLLLFQPGCVSPIKYGDRLKVAVLLGERRVSTLLDLVLGGKPVIP